MWPPLRFGPLLGFGLTLSVVGCGETRVGLQWSYRIDPALVDEVMRLEAEITEGGCDEDGEIRWLSNFPPGVVGSAPPALEAGRYAFVVEGRDRDCRAIARACESVELPRSGPVSLMVGSVEPTARCPGRCSDGVCAGAPDGGNASDGGTDAQLPLARVRAEVRASNPSLVIVTFEADVSSVPAIYWREVAELGLAIRADSTQEYRVVRAQRAEPRVLHLTLSAPMSWQDRASLVYDRPTSSALRLRVGEEGVESFVVPIERSGFSEPASLFYVSPGGNDLLDGRSPETAWRTLAHVADTVPPNGAHILFERGGSFSHPSELRLRGGSAEAPVVYGAYGVGARPRWQYTGEMGVFVLPGDHSVLRELNIEGPEPSDAGLTWLLYFNGDRGGESDVSVLATRLQGGTAAILSDSAVQKLVLRGVDIDAVDGTGTRAEVGESCITFDTLNESEITDVRIFGCADHGIAINSASDASPVSFQRIEVRSVGGSALRAEFGPGHRIDDLYSEGNESMLYASRAPVEVVGAVSIDDSPRAQDVLLGPGVTVSNLLISLRVGRRAIHFAQFELDPEGGDASIDYATILYASTAAMRCGAGSLDECAFTIGDAVEYGVSLQHSVLVAPSLNEAFYAMGNIAELSDVSLFVGESNLYDMRVLNPFALLGPGALAPVNWTQWMTLAEPGAVLGSTDLPSEGVTRPAEAIPPTGSAAAGTRTSPALIAYDVIGRTRTTPGALGALEAE